MSDVSWMGVTPLLVALLAASPAAGAPFPVNSTGNGADATPGDGTCATGGGLCTLRAAIMEANAFPGADTISFNIAPAGPKTISPGSALPNITEAVTIDGTTQPGYAGTPIVEIAGTLAGAGASGLTLAAGSSNSTIRGLVINRFSANGIVVDASSNNVIEKNYIGTNVAGNANLGNTVHGIQIINGASNNTIGGLAAGAGNVISGNLTNGIDIIQGGTTGNQVLGNIIGLDAAGNADLGNTFVGVAVGQGATANIIGDAGAGRNIISGNNQYGVRIVDGGTSNNEVRNNYIGLDVTGTIPWGNSSDGVRLEAGGAASGNIIGGTVAGRGNVISGNGGVGVTVLNFMTTTTIAGNLIGTNAAGTAAIANAVGIRITSSSGNTVGGTTAAARNVVSGNGGNGIEILNAGATGNFVRGNYIGLNATGNAPVANGNDGINIWLATGNTIGGTAAGAGNVIGGNQSGIYIGDITATGNLIQGNLIGTDATGNGPVANITGIFLDAASTTVGGTAAAARNVISGNSFTGLWIRGANGIVIQGNYLGTASDGTSALGNRFGVYLTGGANNNTIGGTAAGASNRIAHNTDDGIALISTAGTGNRISANQIHSNTGLGIDLNDDGITANDVGDGDGGPNNRQNYPILSAATTVGGSVNIAGSLNSAASTNYVVEFFATAPAAGTDEGERFLGSTNVTTDATGNAVFGVTFAAAVLPAENVTATATDPTNNTSEFSAAVKAVGSLVVTTTADTVDGTTTSVANLVASPGADGRISLREAIQATEATAGPDTIRFGIPLADPNHFYYRNDSIASSLTTVQATALSDAAIPDFDPDYPPGLTRSWYRIRPTSSLPFTADVVVIDATTQPGYLTGGPVVELDGVSAGFNGRGFTLTTSSVTLKGFVVNRFGREGITSSAPTTVVQGCYLGTDASGTLPRPDGVGAGGAEVYLGGNGSQLGGLTAAERNVIASRIWIDANNVVIQGNYVGTDVTGTASLGVNYSGITLQPVVSPTVSNVTIGGTAAGSANVVSGSLQHGIALVGAGTQNNVIEGNFIGTNASGTTPLGNSWDGVNVSTSASNNRIGGVAAGAKNRIASNTGRGVVLDATAGSGNAILSNEIYGNGGIGIDLNADGVTANDGGDVDGGPNALLNFPFVTSVQDSGGTLTSYFKLDVPAGSYRIEFFKNPSGADGSGNGEGEIFAASRSLTHPGGGSVNFTHTFAGSVGDVITATTTFCTDGAACTAYGSSSEFSGAVTAVTTVVKLTSFTALARDGAVDLFWKTGSEIDNLGFHLYRSLSANGPFARITDAVIPGLGSSPTGASYTHRDSSVSNGQTYFYKLEDIETTGRTTLHGPVSATPNEDAPALGDDDPSESEGRRSSHGDPSNVSMRIVERGMHGLLLELTTGGFFAIPSSDGAVRIEVPGFEELGEQGSPQLPVKRVWLDALAGRGVRIISVRSYEVTTFTDLRPLDAPAPELVALARGTVRAGSRRLRASKGDALGVFPAEAARVVQTGFQGDTKKALLELAPLRWDAGSGELVWSRRLQVRLGFEGVEPSERSQGGPRGRRHGAEASHGARSVLARLLTSRAGLYQVRYEDVFQGRHRAQSPESLRLSRLGEAVAYHVEPSPDRFGPGSRLYFLGTEEAVYELEWSSAGRRMPVRDASPWGSPVSSYLRRSEWEEDRYYQAALLEAPSRWLWDLVLSSSSKSFPFTVHSLAEGERKLQVYLQGASDFEAAPDHHVRVWVNGNLAGEATWDGKAPHTLDVSLTPGILLEWENVISIENAGDTAAPYSMIFLDRFALTMAQKLVADAGEVRGSFRESGTVAIDGMSQGGFVLETSPETSWLRGAHASQGSVSFRVEGGRSYLAVSEEAVLEVRVQRPVRSSLRNVENQADHLIIGPREFLDAARPLLERRRDQGLVSRAVAIEEIYDEFGYGEARPEALKSFLQYAYHHWRGPSLRYVVLLGDATYDEKDNLRTGAVNRVPALMVRTSYLWTASDPSYAAVNGEDELPDFSIGRLPAASVDEARVLVGKILAYEQTGHSLSGRAVMVADDPDAAGDFERDSDAIAARLAPREVERIYLRQRGAAGTRAAVVASFDRGASLLSYVGHGGIALWASENVFDNDAVKSLHPQPQQPIVMTMNCLNGYFHFPYFDALGEALVKAKDKGAIAAFAPSGLSLNAPAHRYHRALVDELISGRHLRLGDAVLRAQQTYAESGFFPELLAIYHLLGDPALVLR